MATTIRPRIRGVREQIKDARADYAMKMTQVEARCPGAIDIIRLWDCTDGYSHFECHVSRARDTSLTKLAHDQFGHGRLKKISECEWAVFVDAPQCAPQASPAVRAAGEFAREMEYRRGKPSSGRAQGNREGLDTSLPHFGHNA